MATTNANIPDADSRQVARDFIVKAAREQWGRGWDKLSEEQQDTEVRAAFATWVISGAYRNGREFDGVHVQKMWESVKAVR